MRAYDAFFFGALFFLLGVLVASMGWHEAVWWIVGGGIALSIAFQLCHRKKHSNILSNVRMWWWGEGWLVVAVLLFFIPAGAFYYRTDDAHFSRAPLPEDERTFRVAVVSHPTVKEGTQEAVFALEGYNIRVLAKLPAYPAFSYGDRAMFEGRIEKPFSDSYRTYLAKERIRGVMAFPKIFAHESGNLSFRAALYMFRDKIVDAFRRTLPAKEAALMAGVTVGAREDFSEEFRAAMAKSGTTHITALSGYNISVVIQYVMWFLLFVFPRRSAFIATLGVVLAFVLMTGAEASVVRAAVMGAIALLASHVGRRASTRNIIILAALAMVLVNPKVLAFDLGFQLSFLALLGIVYLKPALDRFFGWGRDHGRGVFSWRENLTTTASAQFAVAPLLIHTFGSVSVTSLAANLLVLEVVPLTMGLGFILAGVSLVSLFLSKLIALVALLFLKFQTFVIELFATLAIPVGPTFSLGTVLLYYGAIVVFVYYVRRNRFIPRKI
ncbi:MAG: ComEC/Rec2 family competence protein [Candidatus Brennerbacteria bacterium]|nr:ComEC/Rec2 family competence protein [Candidatus Brennerbacteria bacterium]